MTNILSVSGSPIKDSSTDLLLERLSHDLAHRIGTRKVVVSQVRLNELVIKPCQACGEVPDEGFCFFDDGMSDLYKQIAACDCLLFGTPIYFDSVSAQSKLFIDRCNCMRPPDFGNTDPAHLFIKRLPRKRPGAIILVGGEKAWYEGARRTIAGFFKWIEIESHGLITYGSPDYNLKGTAIQSTGTLAEIESLADTLCKRIEIAHG